MYSHAKYERNVRPCSPWNETHERPQALVTAPSAQAGAREEEGLEASEEPVTCQAAGVFCPESCSQNVQASPIKVLLLFFVPFPKMKWGRRYFTSYLSARVKLTT